MDILKATFFKTPFLKRLSNDRSQYECSENCHFQKDGSEDGKIFSKQCFLKRSNKNGSFPNNKNGPFKTAVKTYFFQIFILKNAFLIMNNLTLLYPNSCSRYYERPFSNDNFFYVKIYKQVVRKTYINFFASWSTWKHTLYSPHLEVHLLPGRDEA